MNNYRTTAMVALMIGITVLAYGIWSYFDSRNEIRFGDATVVIEDAEVSPAVWIGLVVVVAAGATMVATRGKRA